MQHSNRLLVAKRAQVQAAGSAHPLSCLIETSSLLLIDYPQPSVGWYRCAMRRTIYSHTVTLICTWPTLYTGLNTQVSHSIPNNAPIPHVNLRRDKWLPAGKEQRVAPTGHQKICGNNIWEGRMQAAMAKKKRHSRAEIATKLAQANDLATRGKVQSEIARTLGVSVMTLHRWRKAPPGPQPALVATAEAREPDRIRGADDRIAELQLENSRLRRVVTDLLLEKVKLEEATQSQSSVA